MPRNNMSKVYEVSTLDGKVLDNRGKGYVSRKAARAAADRRGLCPTETRLMGARKPHCNDAQGWDDHRLRAGIAAR